jgi:hypothetical protein
MAKNLLRRQFSNMYGKNRPYQNPEPLPVVKDKLPEIEPPSITVSGILIFTFLLFVAIFIYLNRNKIYSLMEKAYNDFKPGNQIDDIESKYHKLFQQYNDASMNSDSKLKEQQEKMNEIMEKGNSRMDTLESREKRLIELLEKNQTCNSIEKKEKETKETEKKEEKSALKQLDHKISGYTKEQTVTSNGFCYIGYDNNQRDCTHVSEGDICMSGQIFPTMDVCLYPKFRH